MTISAGRTAGTTQLLRELFAQSRELMIVELALVRAEMRERMSAAISGAGLAAAGAGLLFAGVIVLLVALGLALTRFGLPNDLAFFVVALAATFAGGLLLRSGAQALRAANLVPRRSVAQAASLFTGVRHDR